jgi:biopolymer transport protein ExbB
VKYDMQQTLRARLASGRRAFWRSFRAAPVIAVTAAAMLIAPAASAQTQDNSSPAAPAAAPAAPTAAPPATTAPVTAPVAAPAAAPALNAPAAAATGAPSNADSAEPAPEAAAPPIGAVQLTDDLSPWGMFLNADIVVKIVMIGLLVASVVTWTVFFAKTVELRGARNAVRRDLRILNGAATIAQAHEQLRDGNSAVAVLMQSAAQEIRLSASLRAEGLKERIALQLERIEMSVSRKISRGTGVLATIGSTAPFVGLFGTVWGIMNSFIGISNAHTTNLAVVAPGIAQALLATAFGLVAAIPAVVVYNVLARQTQQYRAFLGDASAQVMRLVSRDLDRAKLPLSQAAE